MGKRSKRRVTKEKEDLKMAWPKRTVVWWDLRGVPVPDGFNPRCIRACLKWACSKFFGSKEVTIYAFHDLFSQAIPDSDLEGLASSGILIRHAGVVTWGLTEHIDAWAEKNQPSEAIMMLVCRDHSYPIQNKFKALGYTFIRPLFWTRKALLKQISPHVDHTYKYNHKDDDEPPWFCLLCKYPCSTYHHLMAHLKGPDHAATEIAWQRHIAMQPPKVRVPRKPKAVVWWDIDSCPVPHNFDPSCVRLSIQSALYDSFGSLPCTIYAMGNLKPIPARTIKSLSSSGIFITHTIMGLRDFNSTFLLWSIRNPPPVVVILISDDMVWSFKDLTGLEASGYTVIRAYPGSANSCEKWLWGNLIKETPVETNSRIVEDKCDATDEPLYYCRQCKFPTCNYRSFANHLRDVEHIHQERVVEYSRRTDAAYRLKNIQESERSNLQDQLKDTCTNQSFANHLNRNEEHFVERIEASNRMEKKQETKPTYLQALLKNTCNYKN